MSSVIFELGMSQKVSGMVSSGRIKCDTRISHERWSKLHGFCVWIPNALMRYSPIDRDTLLARFHAREDGHMLSGAAAFAAMWRAIPLLRPLGIAARNPIVLAMLERAYRGFLRVRPRLQRWLRRREARA